MIGIGTLINSVSIVAGGLVGHFAGKLFRAEQQDALTKACGISTMFIAIAGAMQGMLQIDGGNLVSGKSMLVVLCLAIGTMVGELLGIEKGFERFGEWLKQKSGNSGDKEFVNAFVTTSLTVCIGAMANCRLDSGRHFRRLLHPRGQIGAGLYHRRGNDLVHGQGLRLLRHSRFPV